MKASSVVPVGPLRNFGTMHGLFDTVAKELVARFVHRHTTGPGQILAADEDLMLRTKLVAWILGKVWTLPDCFPLPSGRSVKSFRLVRSSGMTFRNGRRRRSS